MTDEDCPTEYSCEDDDEDEETINQCIPISGVCACSVLAESIGASTSCQKSVENIGVCDGGRSCQGGALTECSAAVPSLEVCDGIDNDCDGFLDGEDAADLLANEPQLCENQQGVCEGAVKTASLCVGGVYQGCTGTQYEFHSNDYESPLELRCDGLDNDCDGVADEDFSMMTLDGVLVAGLGTACGTGACAGGKTECNDAANGLQCTTEYKPLDKPVESCDAVDNDCDGFTDADDAQDLLKAVPLCEKQDGVCFGASKSVSLCVAGQWEACADSHYLIFSPLYQSTNELACDGNDNDCDGLVDEDFTDTDSDGDADCVDLDDDNDLLMEELDN